MRWVVTNLLGGMFLNTAWISRIANEKYTGFSSPFFSFLAAVFLDFLSIYGLTGDWCISLELQSFSEEENTYIPALTHQQAVSASQEQNVSHNRLPPVLETRTRMRTRASPTTKRTRISQTNAGGDVGTRCWWLLRRSKLRSSGLFNTAR